MNSTRRNMLLAVVLGFLVLLDLGSAPDNRPARDVGPLLPQLDVQRAARIELLGTAGESLVLGSARVVIPSGRALLVPSTQPCTESGREVNMAAWAGRVQGALETCRAKRTPSVASPSMVGVVVRSYP